jgi:hypothetical protein
MTSDARDEESVVKACEGFMAAEYGELNLEPMHVRMGLGFAEARRGLPKRIHTLGALRAELGAGDWRFCVSMDSVPDTVTSKGPNWWPWMQCVFRPFVAPNKRRLMPSSAENCRPVSLARFDGVDQMLSKYPELGVEELREVITVPTIVGSVPHVATGTDVSLRLVMGDNAGMYIFLEDGTRTFVPAGFLALVVLYFVRTHIIADAAVPHAKAVGLASTTVTCGKANNVVTNGRVARAWGMSTCTGPEHLVQSAQWDTLIGVGCKRMKENKFYVLTLSAMQGAVKGSVLPSSLERSVTWILSKETMHRVVLMLSGKGFEGTKLGCLPPLDPHMRLPELMGVQGCDIYPYEAGIMSTLIYYRQATAVASLLNDPRWATDFVLLATVGCPERRMTLSEELVNASLGCMDLDPVIAKCVEKLEKRKFSFMLQGGQGGALAMPVVNRLCWVSNERAGKPECRKTERGFAPWCVMGALLRCVKQHMTSTYIFHLYNYMMDAMQRMRVFTDWQGTLSAATMKAQTEAITTCLRVLLRSKHLERKHFVDMYNHAQTPEWVKIEFSEMAAGASLDPFPRVQVVDLKRERVVDEEEEEEESPKKACV